MKLSSGSETGESASGSFKPSNWMNSAFILMISFQITAWNVQDFNGFLMKQFLFFTMNQTFDLFSLICELPGMILN